MRTALVIALCAAGCFSDRGLAIEIDVGGTGAASVALFVGRACDPTEVSCESVSTPGASCALQSDVWLRDGQLSYRADVKGASATFRFAADKPSALPIVVAVGLDAAGAPIATATLLDLDIPTDGARIATATLVAAGPVSRPPPGKTDEDRVAMWAAPKASAACLVVEHWRDGAVERVAIAPADDPDCRGDAGPNRATDCVTPQVDGAACTIGARLCNADGTVGACTAERPTTCVPEAACGCADNGCIEALGSAKVPHVECDVIYDLRGACGRQAIDLGSKFAGGCDHARLSNAALSGFDSSVVIDGVKLELTSPSSGECSFALLSSGVPTAPALPHLAVLRLDNKSGAVALPVVLKYTMGVCGGPLPNKACTVTLAETDRMWSCVD